MPKNYRVFIDATLMTQWKMLSELSQFSGRGLGCSAQAGGGEFLMKQKQAHAKVLIKKMIANVFHLTEN